MKRHWMIEQTFIRKRLFHECDRCMDHVGPGVKKALALSCLKEFFKKPRWDVRREEVTKYKCSPSQKMSLFFCRKTLTPSQPDRFFTEVDFEISSAAEATSVHLCAEKGSTFAPTLALQGAQLHPGRPKSEPSITAGVLQKH